MWVTYPSAFKSVGIGFTHFPFHNDWYTPET